MGRTGAILVWTVLAAVVAIPVAVAATSPLLQWRDPVYVAAGLAGVIGLTLLLIQPLLAGGYLPGLPVARARHAHRAAGGLLVAAVAIHVAGLWLTSPPDVVDALLLASPTPFSIWGVIAMWAVLAAALLAVLRRRLPLRPRHWRRLHTGAATLIAVGTVVHALLIEGTMGTASKTVLCVSVLGATASVVAGTVRQRRRA